MPHPILRAAGGAVLAVAATLTLSACGSSTKAPAATTAGTQTHTSASTAATKTASGQTTVTISNYMFKPMKLQVTAGTKVTFHNEDATAHTATGDTFDSGTIAPNSSKTVTFTKPGTYPYKCLFHAFMTATITVVPKA